MRRLFEGGACSSNYCNWQRKSLLHLGQNVITFRTLLDLGLPQEIFWILTSSGPLSWVFESFRQDIGQFHSLRMKACKL